ncbi:MAG TPA: hypothetical protein VJJ24_00525 [Candidatus Paceibacterota bacterium]
MLEQDLEKRLDRIEKLTEENNHMLHKLRRGQMWASLMRALYWLVALGVAAATYVWLEPYLKTLIDTYANLSGLFK